MKNLDSVVIFLVFTFHPHVSVGAVAFARICNSLQSLYVSLFHSGRDSTNYSSLRIQQLR